MPLPTGFSSWEHLQTVLMQTQNRIVREEFNDVGPEDWDPDITTSRGSLRVACTLRDTDSALETKLKLDLFYLVLKKAADFHPAIYGIPVATFQESVEFKPQIRLHFLQDAQSVPQGEWPVRADICFRLMNETSAGMTESKARSLGQEIRSTFGTGVGYTWRKGKILVTYKRPDQGYHIQLYAYSESEAREVLQKVLSINEHTIDNDYLVVHEPKKNNLAVPPTKTIYGSLRKMPRWRPTAIVRFRYASLQLHGLPNDVILCDLSGRWRKALVRG